MVGREVNEIQQDSVMNSSKEESADPRATDGLTKKPRVRSDPETLLLSEDTEVLALNVLSKQDDYFSGDEVLSVLLEHDLRFGICSFFIDRRTAGRGSILFSVADMMKPGSLTLIICQHSRPKD